MVITYRGSNNNATYNVPTASGCDSLVTLNLTINNSTTGTDVQTACDNFTWIDGVTYTASNNTAVHTLVGANDAGCDSIVTLNLTKTTSSLLTDNSDLSSLLIYGMELLMIVVELIIIAKELVVLITTV